MGVRVGRDVFYILAILLRLLTRCEASGNKMALALITFTSPVVPEWALFLP